MVWAGVPLTSSGLGSSQAVVWNTSSMPKHRFILWLMLKRCLSTQDKWCQMGVVGPNRCHLCEMMEENHNHIFFACPFANEVVKTMKWLIIYRGVHRWREVIYWLCTKFKRRFVRAKTCKATFATVIYHIWNE